MKVITVLLGASNPPQLQLQIETRDEFLILLRATLLLARDSGKGHPTFELARAMHTELYREAPADWVDTAIENWPDYAKTISDTGGI